jgi:hypothetical protein
MAHRVAFYPCCAIDIAEPLKLLHTFADEVVFCDINRLFQADWRKIAARITDAVPKAVFVNEDARTAVSAMDRIDVLFYRSDSTGEGGSGLFVLGDSFLPHLLRRFAARGGYIITDGSNSRGGNFKGMTRASGLIKHGWRFGKAPEQPLLAKHGLYVISVRPDGRPQPGDDLPTADRSQGAPATQV